MTRLRNERVFLALTMAALASLAGCDGGDGYLGGAIPIGAQPMALEPGGTVAIGMDGVTGYSIVPIGTDTFRIVWSGQGTTAATTGTDFWGSVWTTGTFTLFVPGCADGSCALEADDDITPVMPVAAPTGERIDWDTVTSFGLDGMDVAVSVQPLYFDAYIDGKRQPTLVYGASGASQIQPTALPIAVTAAP